MAIFCSQKAANLASVFVLLGIAGYIVKLVLSKTRASALFPARMHRAKVQSPPVILLSSLQGFQDCGQHFELLLWPFCVGRVFYC